MYPTEVIYQSNYRGYPINGSEREGCYKKILERILDQFEYMLYRHNKLLFIRFDVRFPQLGSFSPDNSLFTRFMATFSQSLRRDGVDHRYIWVREQSLSAPNQHYHCCLLLNGNIRQSIHDPIQKAKRQWGELLGMGENHGLINDCTRDRYGNPQKNGLMIKRGTKSYDRMVGRCFEWASYLAKTATKDDPPAGVRTFGCSKSWHR
ncbi:MAG: inovirus-type Gp2 protein [Lentisphaerae bacterium]|jgi:hypothetical protein|nr:inovirus-type Gp2 protein [Lentisphaerota bacterium]MBT5607200.1 inovirus-type Gp2 protein [Lentisphaerota bacterium]MBT7062001.1 inovirus-type Gp2 protein [Lentisphaerota bacterium]